MQFIRECTSVVSECTQKPSHRDENLLLNSTDLSCTKLIHINGVKKIQLDVRWLFQSKRATKWWMAVHFSSLRVTKNTLTHFFLSLSYNMSTYLVQFIAIFCADHKGLCFSFCLCQETFNVVERIFCSEALAYSLVNSIFFSYDNGT